MSSSNNKTISLRASSTNLKQLRKLITVPIININPNTSSSISAETTTSTIGRTTKITWRNYSKEIRSKRISRVRRKASGLR
jgi:hypothetical protein